MDSLANVQVLIVDDNRQMRFLVRTILRAAGMYRVAEAESAEEAIDLMNRFTVDIVIADWHMSPVDGIALTQRIRSGREVPNREAPIVMLTAHTELARVAAARDAGVHGMVRKPISTQLLLNRVSAALTDQRQFVTSPTFFGPDRRRVAVRDYAGPFRRATDRDDADFMVDDGPQRAAAR